MLCAVVIVRLGCFSLVGELPYLFERLVLMHANAPLVAALGPRESAVLAFLTGLGRDRWLFRRLRESMLADNILLLLLVAGVRKATRRRRRGALTLWYVRRTDIVVRGPRLLRTIACRKLRSSTEGSQGGSELHRTSWHTDRTAVAPAGGERSTLESARGALPFKIGPAGGPHKTACWAYFC